MAAGKGRYNDSLKHKRHITEIQDKTREAVKNVVANVAVVIVVCVVASDRSRKNVDRVHD